MTEGDGVMWWRQTKARVRRAWVLRVDPEVDQSVLDREHLRARLAAVEMMIQSVLPATVVERRRQPR